MTTFKTLIFNFDNLPVLSNKDKNMTPAQMTAPIMRSEDQSGVVIRLTNTSHTEDSHIYGKNVTRWFDENEVEHVKRILNGTDENWGLMRYFSDL